MAFREVHVIEVKEVLRLWLRRKGYRAIAKVGPVDRKTARRYIEAAKKCGLDREGDEEQLTDELIGMVVEKVRPRGPGIRGKTWKFCEKQREFLQAKVDLGLRLTKVRKLLKRHTGQDVPYRTFHRFASEELGFGGKKTTVRVADCDPGQELQVDFGRMGVVDWDGSGRKRTLWALLFKGSIQPPPIRLADVPPDVRGDSRGFRGGMAVLRRRVSRGDSGQHESDR